MPEKKLGTISFETVYLWKKNCQIYFLVKTLNLHNTCIKIKSNQVFYYTRCITPKRVTSLRGPFPRHCARATQLLRRNVAAVASYWQHCVRFDRPEI